MLKWSSAFANIAAGGGGGGAKLLTEVPLSGTVRPVPRKYAVGHHCKKYIDNFSLSKFGICVHANAKFTK